MPSVVWNFFDKSGENVVCNTCGHAMTKPKDRQTTHYIRHLESLHPEIYEEYIKADTAKKIERHKGKSAIDVANAERAAAGCAPRKRSRRRLFMSGEISDEEQGQLSEMAKYVF